VTFRRCYAHDCRRGFTFGVDDTTRGVANLLVEDTLALDNYNRTNPNDNGDGFGCTNGVVAPVFRRCVVRGALDTGFDIKSGGVLLDRCLSYNNHHANYKIWNQVPGVIDSGPWSAAPARLINCIGYGAGFSGDEPAAQCISMAGCNIQLANCTLVGGYGKVIAAGYNKPGNDPTSNTVTNCTIVAEHNEALFGSGQVSIPPTCDYNLYYLPNDTRVFWAPNDGADLTQAKVKAHPGSFGIHSVFAEPQFVNQAGRDFHLGPGSPARSAGLWLSFVTEDFSGDPRLIGLPPDLGAFTTSAPNHAPSAPESGTITPSPRPLVGQNLTAEALGARDVDGDKLSYVYEWSKSVDRGKTWSAWGWKSSSLTTGMLSKSYTSTGDRWKVRASANDGRLSSATVELATVTINTPAAAPSSVLITPSPRAGSEDNLTATASGSTDAEGDPLTYVYQWCKSTDGGVTWGAWGATTKSTTIATLDKSLTSAGEQWKARAAANDGYETGASTEGSAVVINATPTAPTTVALTPGPRALDDQNLTVQAEGSTGGEGGPLVYIYQWYKSTDGGKTWSLSFTCRSAGAGALGRSLTTPGDRWKVRAAANDGCSTGACLESAVVTVNTLPITPGSVVISPTPQAGDNDSLTATASGSTDAEGDSLRYVYQWCKSTDGGKTWDAWGRTTTSATTATLDKSLTSVDEQWKVRSAANDGYQTGLTTESAAVAVVAGTPPTAPTVVTLTPGPRALDGQNLTAKATGSVDPDGDPLTYIYQWYRSTDRGKTWVLRYTRPSTTTAALDRSLTIAGEWWKARAAASDGRSTGPGLESAAVIINTTPKAPTSVVIGPSPRAGSDDNLAATATGSTDADGDALFLVYQWCKSTDGGVTWGPWGWTTKSTTTATLAKSLTSAGEQWKVRTAANDSYETGPPTESSVVVINATPTAPTTVALTPGPRALDDQNLTVQAEGSTDGENDPLTYTYDWYKSTDGGKTWSLGFTCSSAASGALGRSLTTAGDRWKVRAAANDGCSTGSFLESAVVTVNTLPAAPSSVAITPSPQAGNDDNLTAAATGSTDAEGDSLTYVYQWCKSTDGGKTWGAWGGTTKSTATAVLSKSLTSVGDQWKVRAAANDGYQTGTATESVTIETVSAVTVASASAPLAVMASAATTRDQNVAITVNLTAAAEVGASVLNLAGREVAVIPANRLAAGISTVWWNGRSTFGTRVPGGQYLVRLQARGADGNSANCLIPLRR
jgi:hypothetical protein